MSIIPIFTIPIGALVGGAIGSSKKKVEKFVINGTIENYNTVKNDLLHYQIRSNTNLPDNYKDIIGFPLLYNDLQLFSIFHLTQNQCSPIRKVHKLDYHFVFNSMRIK